MLDNIKETIFDTSLNIEHAFEEDGFLYANRIGNCYTPPHRCIEKTKRGYRLRSTTSGLLVSRKSFKDLEKFLSWCARYCTFFGDKKESKEVWRKLMEGKNKKYFYKDLTETISL